MLTNLFDKVFVRSMRRWGVPILRVSVGVVFVWFGLLKLMGASPVVDMIQQTYSFLPTEHFVLFLGIFELLIGLGLLFKFSLRFTLALLWGFLAGTFTAIFMVPELFYTGSPFYLTMEGEFVAKNLVLLAAGLAIAGHEVRYY